LLRAFIDVKEYSDTHLMWLVIIHLTFVGSGVLLAWMDNITSKTKPH
jgi:uncharacterized protein (TIGR00645 family)